MEIGLKERRVGLAHYYHLEPGDGTRYEFIIVRKDPENLWCAEVNRIGFKGYLYHPISITSCLNELEDGSIAPKHNPQELQMHHFLLYMSEGAHSDCNPWTARAACFAMWRFLQDEREGSHGY